MTEEIKEILHRLKTKSIKYKYCLDNKISFNDEDYEAKLLYDYITNLQEENERLKEVRRNERRNKRNIR